MDTEYYVGQSIQIKSLKIKEIIEKADGLWYAVGTDESCFTILVPSEDLI